MSHSIKIGQNAAFKIDRPKPQSEGFLVDVSNRIFECLDEYHKDNNFAVRAYPEGSPAIRTPRGDIWVFRPLNAMVAVPGAQLDANGVVLGSEDFLSAYIDPPARVLAENLTQNLCPTKDGQPTLLTTKLPEPVQTTAPYHWTHQFEWRGLPIEITSFVTGRVLQFRIWFMMAQFEHE